MSNVIIVDYGLCNLDSVFRAVKECGANAIVTILSALNNCA
jgi:imidazoleglycerol phosphate synthase glutamine amidotransferase subunit HisH